MALLEVRNLHTFFTTKKGIVKAVNDVSYTLEAGKAIGIVGESGSGKSVSAMSILQLLDGDGFAGTTFTDDTDGFAGIESVGNIIDSLNDTLFCGKEGMKVFYFQ